MEELFQLSKPAPSRSRSAILAKGFRPFFVLAAIHAVVMVPLWILIHADVAPANRYFLPSSWHAHEMVFGYTIAVIAGFLLTAVSNWTKKETATGPLLGLLCAVWLAGRAAPLLAPRLPDLAIAIVSLAFLPLFALVIARPILSTRSRRNYGILLVVLAMFLAQLTTHVGVLRSNFLWESAGTKVAVDLIVVLILVIGGRIIPLFTRNTTKAEGIRSIPWLDRGSIASAVAICVVDGAGLQGWWIGVLAGVAAALTLARTVHWGLGSTARAPLLWVLHVGYLFIPAGFALRALGELVPEITASTSLHLLTVGAIGTLTLGMMARVSLGHTGRLLESPRSVTAAFVLVIVAAVVRVAGPLVGGVLHRPSLHLAGTLFSLAFLIFLLRLGPLLFKPRPDGRPG